MVPELFKVPIYAELLPLFKPQWLEANIIPVLVNVLIVVSFTNAVFPVTLTVPLLVIAVMVPDPVLVSAAELPDTVTPELIVTLEPSPEISKAVQSVEIVSEVPETIEQLSAKRIEVPEKK